MRLKTVIEVLEKARERYVNKHGVEPHFYKFPNQVSPFLCAEVDKDCYGVVRIKAPSVPLVSKSLDKFLEAMK